MSKRNLSQDLSRKITHMMFFLSVLVVYIHYYSLNYVLQPEYEWERAVEDIISQGIARVAVPLFFMISGYLTFSVKGIESGRGVLKQLPRKVKTLLIPYLIWNIIYMLFHGALAYGIQNINVFTVVHVVKSVFLYQENGAFWYVFQLMMLSLLAPAMYYLYRNRVLASVTTALFFVAYLLIIENTKYFLLPGLLFYSIGAVAALHMSKYVEHGSKRVSIIAAILFVLLLGWRYFLMDLTTDVSVLRNSVSYRLFEFMAPISLWYAIDLLQFHRYAGRMFEKTSFMIYAIHGMVITIINSIVSALDIQLSPILRLIEYLIMPLAIVGMIVVVCSLVRKYFPKLYKVVSGER